MGRPLDEPHNGDGAVTPSSTKLALSLSFRSNRLPKKAFQRRDISANRPGTYAILPPSPKRNFLWRSREKRRPAVLYDALAVTLGREGVSALANVGLAAEFIRTVSSLQTYPRLGGGQRLAGDRRRRCDNCPPESRIWDDSRARQSARRRDCPVHTRDCETPAFRPRNGSARRIGLCCLP
jgi:hypothetical protein